VPSPETAAQLQSANDSAAEGLRVDLADGVLCLTIDRPDSLNSVDAAMLNGIADVLESAATDPGIKVVPCEHYRSHQYGRCRQSCRASNPRRAASGPGGNPGSGSRCRGIDRRFLRHRDRI